MQCVESSLWMCVCVCSTQTWIIETITKLPLKAELRLLYLWSQVQVICIVVNTDPNKLMLPMALTVPNTALDATKRRNR